LEEHVVVMIAPFCGVSYNPQRIADLSLVATPPYDVITLEEEERYRDRHPYNIIRLILPRGKEGLDRYQVAAQYLRDWETEGVLIKEKRPSLYPYQQIFTAPSGEIKKRNGFISLVKLEPLGEEGIIPHEGTSPKPVEDRLSLMEACEANLSQIFTLYSDPAGDVMRHFAHVWTSAPRYEFRDDDGVVHRLWQVDDHRVISDIKQGMENRRLLIADGHHRYKTALIYRDKMRVRFPSYSERSPFEYTMMYLTPLEGEGLLILPTHRLATPQEPFDLKGFYKALEKHFALHVFPFDNAGEEEMARKNLFAALDKKIPNRYAFGLYFGGEKRYSHIISREGIRVNDLLKGYPEVLQELDVTLVDRFVLKELFKVELEDVGLLKGRNEVLEEVQAGRYRATFLMNPPSIQQVMRVVEAGEVMPRKTTFFYPKVATGLVTNKIVSDEEVALI
jgi:uncharacterized protein (DUF1015 family)